LILGPDGSRWVAPLYDLATGLTYDPEAVERSLALSIGGERIFNRIRGKQWAKAAEVLGLAPDLLLQRVAAMTSAFPPAFENALADIGDAPGATEVAERTLPVLQKHCSEVVARLTE
jgi:serine/threonine-protein kinase HipA